MHSHAFTAIGRADAGFLDYHEEVLCQPSAGPITALLADTVTILAGPSMVEGLIEHRLNH